MKIIDPITITDAILLSTNVPEGTVAEYAGGTTYGEGAFAGVTTGTAQLVYQSLQAANTGHTPASSPTWWAYRGTVYAAYSGAVTYAADAIVSNIGANVHDLYKSQVAGNVGNALTDITKWVRIGPTNARAMFDDKVVTQTTAPEQIVISMGPVNIATGILLGNVTGDNVTVQVVDATEGVVFSETKSLIQSNSASSFWNWFFKRIERKSYYVKATLPPYANATINVTISKPGGTAACGLCVLGPVIDIGASLYGASPTIKDNSLRTINIDGSANTTIRPWAKQLSIDVVVENDVVDSVFNALAAYRQRNVVWIGSELYDALVVYGAFASVKPVIQNKKQTMASLSIDGAI